MTRIVVPLTASSTAQAQTLAARARAGGADAVELRLDLCLAAGARAEDMLAVIPHLGLPTLLTCRLASEGGAWGGEEAERLALLARGDQAGASWIDLEFASYQGWKPARACLVLSAHDFAGIPPGLPALAEAMHDAGAGIAKIAVTARDAADLAPVRALLLGATAPVAAMAMGEHGLPSRLLAGCWGSAFTFARLEGDAGSAAGQPTLAEVARCRLKAQGAQTQVFGVIGSPVAHSLSPLIHNAAFAHHRLDAVYVPFRVEDAEGFWRACGEWIEGLSITIPHKQALLTAVDDQEPLVERIGAMNTIYRSDTGATVGANTDAPAIIHCLEVAAGTLKGRRVTVLGAGGVSRTAASACLDRGATVVVANRTQERAEALAAELGCSCVSWRDAPLRPFDILINGTSVGMGRERAEESPWPANHHRRGTVVFDTVYLPLETRLLRDAQGAGAATVCGLDLLIAQAVGQFERWTGLEAPEHLMYRLALEKLDPLAITTVARRRSTTGAD
jgi:3-dehydroquinate dehydratase/shikimate dehydrogenase